MSIIQINNLCRSNKEKKMQYGCSTNEGKREIKQFLLAQLPKNAKILDVGAGGGTYYHLLGDQYNWSAVEIWHDAAMHLSHFYNTVYEGNIIDFQYPEEYDLVIFGDVIEHLEIVDAQECIARAKQHAKAILIALPYDYPQDALYGNKAEIHRQIGMTPEIFDERYPGFKLILNYKIHAYYYWTKKEESLCFGF